MRFRAFLIAILSLTLFVHSCKKDSSTPTDSIKIQSLADIKVPKDFNWELSRNVTFKLNLIDSKFGNMQHLMEIYTPEGKLIAKGSASPGKPFETKAYLLNSIKEVYIACTAPDNSVITKQASLTPNTVEVGFSQSAATVASVKNAGKILTVSPDCNTGCTESIALSSNQNVTVSAGKTICVSGSNKTFNVTFSTGGGTLRVCGTGLTLQNVNKNAGTSAIGIVITHGSNVTLPGLDFDRASHVFSNYGTALFNGNLASSGTVNNYGTLTVNSDYNLNSSNITHVNSSTLIVKGTMNVNSTCTFENTGTATVNKLQINNSGIFNNQCKLIIINNLINNKTLNNYAYVEVGTNTQINANANINLINGAYFKTTNLDKIKGYFVGTGSTSLVKITGNIDQNLILDAQQTSTGQKFKGTLQVCYPSTLPTGLCNDGAVQQCDLYIASTGCNPGNGSAPVTDTDNDGLADNLDDYPTDPTKAFDNYVVPGGHDAGATIIFEDLWPKKGDYDLNDVVMSYQLKVITNASNKVVAVTGVYTLTARGGIFHNGFGIEFPISRSSVSNVQGAILEEGQSKAVLILFNNMASQMYYMNTVLTEPTSSTVSYNISFNVSNGPSLNDFGLNEYNPFIWNDDIGRGAEIHLPGKTPTSLVNTSLFGTGDDASNPALGKYYVSSEGYPWAISIPTKGFIYPVEGKEIVTAYLKFPDWVISGGAQFTDWYSNTASGYRNNANLFIK
ncbi:MAG: LruC domain-containing protein [Sphingobacteriaceae bacterium]|nr:LruC domain-containing protein [Sphingobacteriaceae bacterium]